MDFKILFKVWILVAFALIFTVFPLPQLKSASVLSDNNPLPVCASTFDSVLHLLGEENSWGFGSALHGSLFVGNDTLKIINLSVDANYIHVSIPFYILWKNKGRVCVAEIGEQMMSTNSFSEETRLIDFMPLGGSGTGLVQFGFQQREEYVNPLDEKTYDHPEVTSSISLTVLHYDSDSGVTFLAFAIPVSDSGNEVNPKKPSKLKVSIGKNHVLEILKETEKLNKVQTQFLGRYPLPQWINIPEKFILPVKVKAEIKYDSNRSIQNIYAIALALFKGGKPGKAADTLATVLPLNAPPTKGTLHIINDLGYFLVEAKRFSEGVKVLETVLSADSTRTPAYLNLGDAYVGLGQVDLAKTKYRKYCNQMEKAGMGDKIPARIKAQLVK